MPWRKYSPKRGTHGPIYAIGKGIQVRRNERGKWVLFMNAACERKNRTIGEGRPALTKAIKAAEAIVRSLNSIQPAEQTESRGPRAPAFREFCGDWLKESAGRWRESTAERYEQILRIHLDPEPLFKKPMDQIGRRDLKSFLRRLAARRSPATVESVHGVISGVFNEAIDEELIEANPASGILKTILPPKNQRDLKDPEPLAVKERDRFLAFAEQVGTRTEAMLMRVMAFSGFRLGEALAMRREHLDADRRRYFVAQSYKGRRFGKPKAGKTRLVDLPEFLVAELEAHIRFLRKESLGAGRGGQVDLLFPDPQEAGRWPLSQRKVQALMKRVCKAAGLRPRNPHDLRHTYATILLMAHESPGYVQRQLGHSSIAITMDVYCHWIPGEGRKNLERALLGPSAGESRVPNLHIFAYPKKEYR